ncbi:hypothetical protein CKO28_01195 [Rhodovibrio sodomensis]|uniref:Antitoxin VbhA domain-containing protein n=1 Tax=Rhodovibrio sodomensis TaxID=1088 RepID=A0ABS1D8U2_9PROT|nr:hypothetical protein [Rhodovibrio sodomensis]MBK1666659.1 hypothetical protein [Rhodovibrio sodomensis]
MTTGLLDRSHSSDARAFLKPEVQAALDAAAVARANYINAHDPASRLTARSIEEAICARLLGGEPLNPRYRAYIATHGRQIARGR